MNAMPGGLSAHSRGFQHDEAVRRLDCARDKQVRLADRLAGTGGQACAQERLSEARAGVAMREEWLHWIDEAESTEPWADGVWAPPGAARPFALVELVDVPPGVRPGVAAAAWRAPALSDAVREMRERLCTFADEHGVDRAVTADLRLAASEAITNAVIHAYRDRVMPGDVTAGITVDERARRIDVTVADDGMGMGTAPRPDSPGCGHGLGIIAAVTEQMSIRPGASSIGTVVSFSFAI